MKNSSLTITNLKVTVEGKDVVHGVNLTVKPGEIHAIMGPNGAGKSTLAYSLAGHPVYHISGGSITLDGQDITSLAPDERAVAGLFLAFQYPVEVPGVKVNNFLRQAHQARFAHEPSKQFDKVIVFRQYLEQLAAELEVNQSLLSRGLHEGFSGGEKKRLEILQMAVLEPKYAILDETDSGLDVDAIKIVARGVKKTIDKLRTGVVVVTHYQRLLEHIKPDVVHIMIAGQIVHSGGHELVAQIEADGYEYWQQAA